MKPADFIAQITAPAQTVAQSSKIPASVMIAQAGVESGWNLNAQGFNLFGIKATPDWKGAVLLLHTHEVIKGVSTPVMAQFRAYKTWLGSLEDHAQFLLTNPRYKPCFSTANAFDFCKELQDCGYSTNPQYANILIEVIQEHNLLALDK